MSLTLKPALTVAELIEKLKELPPDAVVHRPSDDGPIEIRDVYADPGGAKFAMIE